MARHANETALASAIIAAEIDVWNRIEHELKASGSRLNAARFFLLRAMSGEAVTITDAARRVKATPAAASRLVDRMGSDGLVAKIPNPEDRRSSLLAATEAGLAELERACPSIEAAFSACFSGLDAKEMESLAAALAEISAHAKREGKA